MNRKLLENKVAVITGASGGIGSAIVTRFLGEGARVMAADMVRPDLAGGKRFGFCRTDTRDPLSVRKLFKKTLKVFGGVDIVVNAAAVQKPIGTLISNPDKEWINCVQTNLIGTMLCNKYALPYMIKRKKGKVINFSGGGATFPRPFFSAYSASKAAVVRLTEILAAETKKYGIDVNAVSPGPVYTDMMKDIIEAGKQKSGDDYKIALKVKKNGGDSPEFTADLCVYLASEQSNGVTGKLISARWDDWRGIKKTIRRYGDSIYTLRRIDGREYVKKCAGRGK